MPEASQKLSFVRFIIDIVCSDQSVWRDGGCVRSGADYVAFGKRILGEYSEVAKDGDGEIMALIAALTVV